MCVYISELIYCKIYIKSHGGYNDDLYEFFFKYLSLQKKTKLLTAINNYTKWRSSLKPRGGYSGYKLVGVCPGTPKKGGLRCGHSPKRGVLGAGTAPKKGGLRCGHNQKRGVLGTSTTRKMGNLELIW